MSRNSNNKARYRVNTHIQYSIADRDRGLKLQRCFHEIFKCYSVIIIEFKKNIKMQAAVRIRVCNGITFKIIIKCSNHKVVYLAAHLSAKGISKGVENSVILVT